MMRTTLTLLIVIVTTLASGARYAAAQSYGIELNNTLMPASGAMGGASVARPQDLTSAINANPATLTQFQGTQFMFGGAWAEPTVNIDQAAGLPLLGVGMYSGKSIAPGALGGNIGVTQDLSALGMPVTLGLGFITAAGGAVDYRDQAASNGTNTSLAVFELPVTLGVNLTDRLSVGAGVSLGIAMYDGPIAGLGGMTTDYALRGVVGVNYELADYTSIGAYYQSKQSFRFDNALALNIAPGFPLDVNMDLPENVGIGVANNRLMDGRLLLAMDVLYKHWKGADMYRTLYDNQWVFQFGAQYSVDNYRFRAGYAYAQNPLDPTPTGPLGGVLLPNGIPALYYSQALVAVTGPHRISGGIGMVDVLPGIDMDLMAGGMFRDSEQLGAITRSTISSYWAGFGLTWRFGRGACERLPVVDDWCAECAL